MPDSKENNQMFFDFDDFSDRGSSHGETSNRKAKDDLTPGLFDSELTEEEEMDQFLGRSVPLINLRTIRPRKDRPEKFQPLPPNRPQNACSPLPRKLDPRRRKLLKQNPQDLKPKLNRKLNRKRRFPNHPEP